MKKTILSYMEEIERDREQVNIIIKKLKCDIDSEVYNDLYIWSTISMCIRYEAFTAEAFSILFPDRKVTYNHPWRYTRELAKKTKINISKEYKKAHDAWDIYNTLKHINKTTRKEYIKTIKKYKLKNSEQINYFVYDSLINLLSKFLYMNSSY